MKATSTYCVVDRLKIEQNDTIAIIDGRPELKFIKGQNQRTFEIGTFPRNILEVLRFNRHGTLNTISRPVHGTLQHTAHGSAFGPSWGNPSFLDSSYNGNVQLRQKASDQISKNQRQQKTVSEHFAKERKTTASKQFSYNKLINEQRMQQEYQNSLQVRSKPARPPAPHVQPTEGILIDLSPDEIRSMTMNLNNQSRMAVSSTGCLLDDPIDVPTENEQFESLDQQQQLVRTVQPPPYPMPPQYLNSTTSANSDPFDTSHLSSLDNLYGNSSVPIQRIPESIYNNNPNRYAASNLQCDQLNDMMSASLATLSVSNDVALSSSCNNSQPVTPKKVEKQLLADQLAASNNSMTKINLEHLINMQVPTTTPRSYDFAPVTQHTTAAQTYSNGNYSNTYANHMMNDVRSTHYETNIYNSVAGDSVYGENFYDAVQSQTPSVIYDSTTSVYSTQQQQAIYDEVDAYDEMRWQPQTAALRQAPAPPMQSPQLSQQQINRRLEKINHQQSKIADLMNELSVDNISEEEAIEAMEASNWNQALAVRHFKVERLAK